MQYAALRAIDLLDDDAIYELLAELRAEVAYDMTWMLRVNKNGHCYS